MLRCTLYRPAHFGMQLTQSWKYIELVPQVVEFPRKGHEDGIQLRFVQKGWCFITPSVLAWERMMLYSLRN